HVLLLPNKSREGNLFSHRLMGGQDDVVSVADGSHGWLGRLKQAWPRWEQQQLAQMRRRPSPFAPAACECCAKCCDECAAACEEFPENKYLSACTKACRESAKACREMIKHLTH